MILKLNHKFNHIFQGKAIETKILVAYRYTSLIITSVFYLLTYPEHEIMRKAIIICCLAISSIILSYLYPMFENSSKSIKALISMEIVGNIVLLMPSGGIRSPFIWHSLNTILISSVFLKKGYYWTHFAIYYFAYLLYNKFFNKETISVFEMIRGESNLFLSFIMITIAIHAFALLVNRAKEDGQRLRDANVRLEMANNMIIESMNHSKDLYQSVSILTNQGNREGILGIAFEHIRRITKADNVFFYDMVNGSSRTICGKGNLTIETIEESIRERLDDLVSTKTPLEISIQGLKFLIISLKSTYISYGILGLEIADNQGRGEYENQIEQLQFLSELISTAFERVEMEEVNQRLAISEEQNRIANEIHDGVLQRLFSLSCGIYSLIKRLGACSNDEIVEELNLFRDSTDTTMKELREKVYGLSWKGLGDSGFKSEIRKYIEDIKRLNKVNIPFSIMGDIEHITRAQKKALYRMICEGIGNAIRHGKAKKVEVKLQASPSHISLMIRDDGIGFELDSQGLMTEGLGLRNLYQLTESFQGNIQVESGLEEGTTIEIMIPSMAVRGEKAL